MGFSGDVARLSPNPAAFSGTRESRASLRPFLRRAPAWPRQPWKSSLVELSAVHAVRLALDMFPLKQGNFTLPSLTLFILHAWTLLGMGIYRTGILGPCCRLTGPFGTAFYCFGLRQKWVIFCTFCTERQIIPVSISVVVFFCRFSYFTYMNHSI